MLLAVWGMHAESVQFLLRECRVDIADVDNRGCDVWGNLELGIQQLAEENELPSPAELADVYSLLRCYTSPADFTAFIKGLQYEVAYNEEDDELVLGPIPAAHTDLLQQTERAHTSPNLLPYRAQRLALLHEGSDFARLVIPDLQNIVAEYAQPTAEAQLSGAVIAEAVEADEHAQVHGRMVRRVVE